VTQEHLNQPDPVEAFVYMEIAGISSTLRMVDDSLSSLAEILKGTGMLTAKNQKEATELLSGRVPPDWVSQWEGPDDPSLWLRLVNKKATALIGWVQRV
jgi:Dynein heavy chain.